MTKIEGLTFVHKKNDHNCLNCAKFSNYHEDLICGDVTHKLGKGFDISQGCGLWEKKGCKNWYLANRDGKLVRHELIAEDESIIMGEDIESMNGERKDLAKSVNSRFHLLKRFALSSPWL